MGTVGRNDGDKDRGYLGSGGALEEQQPTVGQRTSAAPTPPTTPAASSTPGGALAPAHAQPGTTNPSGPRGPGRKCCPAAASVRAVARRREIQTWKEEEHGAAESGRGPGAV